MSDREKLQQIGGAAEEVSQLKVDLNNINEKLRQSLSAFQALSQSGGIESWHAQDGKLVVAPPAEFRGQDLSTDGLLGLKELIKVLEEKQRILETLNAAIARLRGLVPHLL
ncbi:MAG: hypothetical protein WBW69_25185 [Candidatus Korobacteraceae bacterium]